MTPNDMPKRRPKRTWTPPQGKPLPVQLPVLRAGIDNAPRRRARRNGGTKYIEGTD